MAGTVTQVHQTLGHIRKVVFTATGDGSDGSFPATAITDKIEGRLVELITNPGATAPTADWDVTLVDANGLDKLQGVGIDRHTTNSEDAPIVFSGTSLHPVVALDDTLTLTIINNSVNDAIIVLTLIYALGP